MGHFGREKWLLYTEDKLPRWQRNAMEEHLRACDRCLDTYLTALLPGDEEEAGKLLSPDFVAKTMARLQKEVKGKKHPAAGMKGRDLSHLLPYYAVAAAITLMLMAGGWFDLLGQRLPQTINNTSQRALKVEKSISFGWSDRMVDAIAVSIDALTGAKEDGANGQK